MSFQNPQRSTLNRCDAAIFEHMKPTDLDRLAAKSNMVDGARNSAPLSGSNPSKTVVVVCTGILALRNALSDGRTGLTELFEVDDILDLRRTERRFQGDVVCLTKSRFCALDATIFDEICASDPIVLADVQKRLREQMHILRDHCVDIGKKTPNERVASFIFEQLNRSQVKTSGETTLRIKISKKAIAEYLGLRSETVSRSFAYLNSTGIISFRSRNALRISNIGSLRQIANGSMPRSSGYEDIRSDTA